MTEKIHQKQWLKNWNVGIKNKESLALKTQCNDSKGGKENRRQEKSDCTEEDFLQFVEKSLKENVSDTDDVLDELLEQFEDILFHS